jgi:hypothetical protein
MAHADGYVMVRRLGDTPFVMAEVVWRKLPPALIASHQDREGTQ